jgi:GTPase SAR1 family protein
LVDAKNSARSECSICVVGNKSDLKESRVIKYNDGAKFCQENSKCYIIVIDLIHYECSAYTGDNVDEIFNTVTKHIINKIENGIIEPQSVVSSYTSNIKNVTIEPNKKQEPQTEWCSSSSC